MILLIQWGANYFLLPWPKQQVVEKLHERETKLNKKKMYIANKAMDHDKSLAYRSNRIIAVLPVFFSPFIYVF